MSGPCTDCGGPDYQTLEARIAELEADLRLSREQTEYANDAMMAMCKRAEQAEAEVQHQTERREEEKLRAVNAEAELARVRSCLAQGKGPARLEVDE